GLLPARGARAADLGTRVQPRLLVHRPPAARQVDDRDRRATVRLQLLRLASPVRGGGRGGRRRPHPADPPAHRVDAARAGRGAAALRPTWTTAHRGLPGGVWVLAVIPVLTYLASFTGWFLGETSQGKAWAQQHPHTAFPFVPDALRSLWHEHAQWLKFHNG